MAILIQLAMFAQLMVPSTRPISIGGAVYTVEYVSGLMAASKGPGGRLQIAHAASDVVCNVAGGGQIKLASNLTPPQQAKAFVHEVVHIAQRCDHRRLPVQERVAQDVADLFDSPVGPFVIKEMAR